MKLLFFCLLLIVNIYYTCGLVLEPVSEQCTNNRVISFDIPNHDNISHESVFEIFKNYNGINQTSDTFLHTLVNDIFDVLDIISTTQYIAKSTIETSIKVHKSIIIAHLINISVDNRHVELLYTKCTLTQNIPIVYDIHKICNRSGDRTWYGFGPKEFVCTENKIERALNKEDIIDIFLNFGSKVLGYESLSVKDIFNLLYIQ